MSRYKWIFLDFDDTLIDYDKCEASALANTFNHYQVKLDKSMVSIYRQINSGLWKELEEGKISSKSLRVERFKRLFYKFSLEINPTEASQVYLNFLGETNFLIPGALDFIKTLKESHRLAMITNGITDTQHGRIDSCHIRSYFDAIIISGEIGQKKPDIAFFDIARKSCETPEVEEILVIGDSLSSDIKGGNNAGIDTCWFNPGGNENPGTADPTFTVSGYDEIYPIISE